MCVHAIYDKASLCVRACSDVGWVAFVIFMVQMLAGDPKPQAHWSVLDKDSGIRLSAGFLLHGAPWTRTYQGRLRGFNQKKFGCFLLFHTLEFGTHQSHIGVNICPDIENSRSVLWQWTWYTGTDLCYQLLLATCTCVSSGKASSCNTIKSIKHCQRFHAHRTG